MQKGAWVGVATLALVAAVGGAGNSTAQEFNWSGAYTGIEGGGGSGSSDWNYISFSDGAGLDIFDNPGGPPDPEISGGIIGAHFGYMNQSGGLVLGIEAAYDGANISGDQVNRDTAAGGALLDPPEVVEVRVDALARLNGRMGVASDRWLAYVTGGLAFASFSAANGGQCTDGAGAPIPGCTFRSEGDFDRTGWNAGAGIGYAVTENVSVGFEYLHYDFGAGDEELLGTCDGCTDILTVGLAPTIDVLQARLSYKFSN